MLVIRFLARFTPSGTVEASFGLLTASRAFASPPRNPAANFSAHVFQTAMWAHDSQVTVLLLCCCCDVAVLWLCRGCAVAVPWLCCAVAVL